MPSPRDEVSTENVARDAKVPEATVRKTRSFTSAEVSSICAAACGDRLEAAWLIQLGLGIRPGELLALSWMDVVGSELHIGHSQRREGGRLDPSGKPEDEGIDASPGDAGWPSECY